jgi:hypothetical protein
MHPIMANFFSTQSNSVHIDVLKCNQATEVEVEQDHHIDTNIRHQQDRESVMQSKHMNNIDNARLSGCDSYPQHAHSIAHPSGDSIAPVAYQQLHQPTFGMFGAKSSDFAAGVEKFESRAADTQDRLAYDRAFMNAPSAHEWYDREDVLSSHVYILSPNEQLAAAANQGDLAKTQQQHSALALQRSTSQQQEQYISCHSLQFWNLSIAISTIPSRVWSSPSSDPSIPRDDAGRQYWVLKLLNAINNTIYVYDARGQIFQKRWNLTVDPPSDHYSAADKEMVAWDILVLTESLHRKGPSVLLSFDKEFWNKATKTESWTFAERMNKIVELLSFSKSRCEKVLGGTGVQTVVANPEILIKTTKGNLRQNGKRQRVLEAGRAAKKRKVC